MKDNKNVHGSFINLIDTLARYKQENPTLIKTLLGCTIA